MQSQYPRYRFPSCPPAASHRQPFLNFGPKLVDIGDNDATLEFLRAKSGKCFKRVYPTIPLSELPADVPYPWRDRVMGDIVKKNGILSSLVRSLKMTLAARKNFRSKSDQLEMLLKEIETVKADEEDSDTIIDIKPVRGFEDLLHQYEAVADVWYSQSFNSKYAGGCLVYFPSRDVKQGTLISPCGDNFDTINIQTINEDETSGIAFPNACAKETLPGQIFEMQGQTVHSECKLAVRLDESCLIYSVGDGDKSPLTLLSQKDVQDPTAVRLSPYITDECLIATSLGQCYLWTENSFEEVISAHSTRFESTSKWREAHFGSHPRQIIFSDPTVIQMYDMREPSYIGHDLFALPSNLLNQKERISMCRCVHGNPFYHILATDYSILMVDERFPTRPVIKWDHMLSTPPQYMTFLEQGPEIEEGAVFVASQVPSEIHGFQFTARGDNTPQALHLPWKVDRARDILKEPSITENVVNVKMLECRFDTSLTGLQAVPWGDGHLVFQLDSHGDIFVQAFQRMDQRENRGPGVENTAVEIAKRWAEQLQTQIKDTGNYVIAPNVWNVFENIQYSRLANASCNLCQPSSAAMLDKSHRYPDALCLSCMHTVERGDHLKTATEQDTMCPRSGSHDLASDFPLVDVDHFSKKSALSGMLLKQWNKEKDISSELKQWDEEVLEFKKKRRKKLNEERKYKAKVKDMSEEAVLARLFGKSPEPSCSNSKVQEQETSSSEEDQSSTDDDSSDQLKNEDEDKNRVVLKIDETSVRSSLDEISKRTRQDEISERIRHDKNNGMTSLCEVSERTSPAGINQRTRLDKSSKSHDKNSERTSPAGINQRTRLNKISKSHDKNSERTSPSGINERTRPDEISERYKNSERTSPCEISERTRMHEISERTTMGPDETSEKAETVWTESLKSPQSVEGTRSTFESPQVSRKRKRHSSESSIKSFRSHLSQLSTESSPGFLSPPNYLRHSASQKYSHSGVSPASSCKDVSQKYSRSRMSPSPSSQQLSQKLFKKQTQSSAGKECNSGSAIKGENSMKQSELLGIGDSEFSWDLFSETSSLFSTPPGEDRYFRGLSSPAKSCGSSVKSQSSSTSSRHSASKSRKKLAHQPGF